MGVAYGAASLWQWRLHPDEPGHGAYFVAEGAGWKEALDFEGSRYVGLVGKILDDLPITRAGPCWDILCEHTGSARSGRPLHRSELHQYSLTWQVGTMAAMPGSTTRLPTDGQLRPITKVARMYHERGIRQVDIAETLHLSAGPGLRLLKRAAELGIVRTAVAVAPGVHTELEEALEAKYGLAEAVVVDVDGTDQDIPAALGSAGASYLETTLTGGERMGISSWSQTLLAVVDRMRPLRLPGADSVIQLVGGLGRPRPR